MRRNHQPLADHQIVIRYLELIPSDKAKMLEDPLRRLKPKGYLRNRNEYRVGTVLHRQSLWEHRIRWHAQGLPPECDLVN